MDEWDPGKTFDKENNRNWFGFQIGASRIISFISKEIMFKIEYSFLSPQLYTHDVMRNIPMHFSSPIGYWSGGHSNDLVLYMMYNLTNNHSLSLVYQDTNKGIAEYSDGIDFNPNLWYKKTLFIEYNYDIVPSLLSLMLRAKNIQSNLFLDSDKFGVEMGIKYNDSDLKLKLNIKKPIISKRDLNHISLKEFKKRFKGI